MNTSKRERVRKGYHRIAFPILFFILIHGVVYALPYLSREEAFSLAFPDTDTIQQKSAVLLPWQQKKVAELSRESMPPRIIRYLKGFQKEQVTGYALVSRTKGKADRFKFMVAVSPDGSVKQVSILSYQGTRGKGICKKRFLKQFIGKALSDPIRVNRDIHAVTGATMSSMALAKEVRIAIACLKVISEAAPGLRNEPRIPAGNAAYP